MLVGFSLDSLDAEKETNPTGELNVNFSHKITDVEEADLSSFSEKVARISFKFKIGYASSSNHVAKIEFTGRALWKGELERIVKSWEEDDKLDPEMKIDFLNRLYKKILTQGVIIADTLNLPSPVPMPKLGQNS